MIGVLRFLGMVNAAVWLGATIFFMLGARTALYSSEMVSLLQPKYHPYFSGVIDHLISIRFYHLSLACALFALLLQTARWLYLGRPSRKVSLGLLIGLFLVVLINGNAIEPQLSKLHATRFSAAAPMVDRDRAVRSFRLWRFASGTLNIVLIGGIIAHLWGVANPSDSPRFISSVKFRG